MKSSSEIKSTNGNEEEVGGVEEAGRNKAI